MSFDPFFDRRPDPGPPAQCASFALFGYFRKCREGKNHVLPLPRPSAESWSFFNVSASINFRMKTETLVYYKSGDCSIWSPQQRTFNSLQICDGFGPTDELALRSVFVYIMTSAGSVDESGMFGVASFRRGFPALIRPRSYTAVLQ